MTKIQSLDVIKLKPVVGELYREFGLWAIIGALVAAAIKRHNDRVDVANLPDSIRRDIGLPLREEGVSRPFSNDRMSRF